MFQEYNKKGEAYPVWIYKPYKADGRKKKVYKIKEGTVFNELGRIGRQVLSTKVRELRKEGWKPLDELITPVIETSVAEKVVVKKVPEEPVVESTTVEDTVVEKLLKGEGLNFSSYLRASGLDSKNQKVRKENRGEYNELLEYWQDKYGKKIYKQGHDYFLKKGD